MTERALTDAEACAILATDPFASGVHRVLTLDQLAALLAREPERSKVAATFARGRSAPAVVIWEPEP